MSTHADHHAAPQHYVMPHHAPMMYAPQPMMMVPAHQAVSSGYPTAAAAAAPPTPSYAAHGGSATQPQQPPQQPQPQHHVGAFHHGAMPMMMPYPQPHPYVAHYGVPPPPPPPVPAVATAATTAAVVQQATPATAPDAAAEKKENPRSAGASDKASSNGELSKSASSSEHEATAAPRSPKHDADNTAPTEAATEGADGATNLYVGGLPDTVSDRRLSAIFSAFGEVSSAKVMLHIHTGQSRGHGFVKFATHDDAVLAIGNMNRALVPMTFSEEWDDNVDLVLEAAALGAHHADDQGAPNAAAMAAAASMSVVTGVEAANPTILEENNIIVAGTVPPTIPGSGDAASEATHQRITVRFADLKAEYKPDAPTNRVFVRNIPLDVSQHQVRSLFEKYGEISKCTLHLDTAAYKAGGVGVRCRIGYVTFIEIKHAVKAAERIHGTRPFPSCAAAVMAKVAESEKKRAERRSDRRAKKAETTEEESAAPAAPAPTAPPAVSAPAVPAAYQHAVYPGQPQQPVPVAGPHGGHMMVAPSAYHPHPTGPADSAAQGAHAAPMMYVPMMVPQMVPNGAAPPVYPHPTAAHPAGAFPAGAMPMAAPPGYMMVPMAPSAMPVAAAPTSVANTTVSGEGSLGSSVCHGKSTPPRAGEERKGSSSVSSSGHSASFLAGAVSQAHSDPASPMGMAAIGAAADWGPVEAGDAAAAKAIQSLWQGDEKKPMLAL